MEKAYATEETNIFILETGMNQLLLLFDAVGDRAFELLRKINRDRFIPQTFALIQLAEKAHKRIASQGRYGEVCFLVP